MGNNIVDRKIDYALVITAQNCNPNGDPALGNRPRTDYDGYGEITDVCLKRKIRNRWQDMGENILTFDEQKIGEKPKSLTEKIEENKEMYNLLKNGKNDEYAEFAKEQWLDVRAFGQVFPIKNKIGSVSLGIRGCATMGIAKSLEIVEIKELIDTRSYNHSEEGFKKGSSTIFPRYFVEKGVYVSYGSIFPQLASLNKFTYDDADKLKFALSTIFENDAATARPSGSMGSTLYWWEHISTERQQHSSIKVHRSLNIEPMDTYPFYKCNPDKLANIKCTILSD